MHLQFLGTGAADWEDPGVHVGDGRRLSSMVVNDWLMIDCGPMTLAAIDEFGVDVDLLTDVVIGHLHEDHFSVPALCAIASRRKASSGPLRVWLNGVGLGRCSVSTVGPERLCFQGYEVGRGFSCPLAEVRTFEANHELTGPGELPAHLFFTFENGETLFYSLDGAWFLPSTWKAVQKLRIDVMIWELTCGNLADWRLWGHCNFGMVKLMAASFRESGALHSGTTMFCSHLARTLCPPQEIYSRELASEGFILAHDGLCWSNGVE